MTKPFIEILRKKLPSKCFISDKEVLDESRFDRSRLKGTSPILMLEPTSDKQIQVILKIANQYKVPIVPRAAGSGKTGGAISTKDCIVLSLKKFKKLMIGVIPAAGKGSRLGVKCKALHIYQEKFLIEYAIDCMINEGLEEIVIIHHGDDIYKQLGTIYQMPSSNGNSSSVRAAKLRYIEQEERKGIAHAVNLVKPIFPNENMLVMFSDILYSGNDLHQMKSMFYKNERNLFGVKHIDNKHLLRESYGYNSHGIFEKPQEVDFLKPHLGLGIYMFKPNVYSFIESTKPGLNDEIQITDTLDLMYKADQISPFVLKG